MIRVSALVYAGIVLLRGDGATGGAAGALV